MKKTINDFRLEKKLTQKELANLTKISVGKISKYETGKKIVPLYHQHAIADVFGVDISEIQFDIEEQKIKRNSSPRKINTNLENSSEDSSIKTESNVLKLETYKEPETTNVIDDCICEIALEYLDSVTENLKLFESDREKFMRLADLKVCLYQFNLDTLNHIKKEKDKKQVVGKISDEVG